MASDDLLCDTLRTQLRHEADLVSLPEREPGRAVERARRRRRHRRTALGVAAVVALAGGVVPVVAGGGDETSDTVAGAGGVLPATGPLTFDWQAGDGGLGMVSSSFQTDDGTVYALSTAPGFTGAASDGWPRALYRLAADGTWQPLDLDGDRPAAIDMSSDGAALYAISTAPAGAGSVPRLSASTDGGESWTSEDLPDVAPPSDDVAWYQDRYLSIETAGDTTLALVTTQFRLDVQASFPEIGGFADVQPSADGLVLTWYPPTSAGGDGAAAVADAQAAWADGSDGAAPLGATPPVTEPAAPTTTQAPPPTDPSVWTRRPAAPSDPAAPTTTTPPPETRTLSWDELGLTGPDDLAPTHQLLHQSGSGWQAVDGVTGLTGEGLTLGTSGERFVADGSDGTVLVSDDGSSWTPVQPPAAGGLLGHAGVTSVGPALLAATPGLPDVSVSSDLGASWQPVDLGAAGVPAGALVQSVSSGPLGVALVVTGTDGWHPLLVVSGDLVDWTVTPIADIVGADTNTTIETTVGADRIVLTATLPPAAPGGPSASRTAVGTLVRD